MCRSTILSGCVLALASLLIQASTLEKLSVEEMSEKSTAIVRGRVEKCAGDLRGSVIYTACRIVVSEKWKGLAGSLVDVYIPGGTARGLSQTFAGAPKLAPGEEYVLFLWAGPSGRNQVIGLSQGAFAIQNTGVRSQATAVRAAVDAKFVDSEGRVTDDAGIEMPVKNLRQRVDRALGGSGR